MNNLLERVSINPNNCFGKPCIKGTRIWVSLILDLLAEGITFEGVLEDYSSLTRGYSSCYSLWFRNVKRKICRNTFGK